MPRSISGSMLSAIEAESSGMCYFLELDFSGGAVRFSTTPRDASWNGFTWTAVGGAIGFSQLTETGDLSAGGLDLTASGVDQSIVSHLLNETYVGRAVKLWLAHFDPTVGTVIASPVLLFSGYMNGGWDVQETRPTDPRVAGTVSITGHCMDRFALLDQKRGLQANPGPHQALFPGDTFFQLIENQAFVKIVWKGKR